MNHEKNDAEFFLGAVGPRGFSGFFDQLRTNEGCTPYLLKTGPGCGKSTLMKRLAQKSSEPVQLIHCSSDPKSLDGVIFAHPAAAVLDATAPHVIEPVCPMVTEQVVSLYDSLDPAVLGLHSQEIQAVNRRCKQLHAQAAAYIKTACCLLSDNRNTVLPALNQAKARTYARRLALHWFPKNTTPGKEQLRYLSAITPDGPVLFENTISALADHVLAFHDEYGTCSRFLMRELRRLALESGQQVITCPCPLSDREPEHLIFPQLRLAFVTSNRWHTFQAESQQNIHCTRFEDAAWLKSRRQRLRFGEKAARDLLAQASLAQNEARRCHDELEGLYRLAVDFEKVDAAACKLEQQLGL